MDKVKFYLKENYNYSICLKINQKKKDSYTIKYIDECLFILDFEFKSVHTLYD